MDEEEAVTLKFRGRTYYFCCDECREEFLENPEDYIVEPASEPEEEEF